MKRNAIVYFVSPQNFINYKISIDSLIRTTSLNDVDVYCFHDGSINVDYRSDVVKYMYFHAVCDFINDFKHAGSLFKFTIPKISILNEYEYIAFLDARTEVFQDLNSIFRNIGDKSKEVSLLNLENTCRRTLSYVRRYYENNRKQLDNIEKEAHPLPNYRSRLVECNSDVVLYNMREIRKNDNEKRWIQIQEFYEKYLLKKFGMDLGFLFHLFYSCKDLNVRYNNVYALIRYNIQMCTIVSHNYHTNPYSNVFRMCYNERVKSLNTNKKNAIVCISNGNKSIENGNRKLIDSLFKTSNLDKIDICWLYVNDVDTSYRSDKVTYINCTDTFRAYKCFNFRMLPFFTPIINIFSRYRKILYIHESRNVDKDVSKIFEQYSFDESDIVGIRKNPDWNVFTWHWIYAINVGPSNNDTRNYIDSNIFLFNVSRFMFKFDYQLKLKNFIEYINTFPLSENTEWTAFINHVYNVNPTLRRDYTSRQKDFEYKINISPTRKQSLRIIACCHKLDESDMCPIINNNPQYYSKMLCGAYKFKKEEVSSEYMRDDVGEHNISKYNNYINEWTGIWWTMYNADYIDADYIGFCHYRRCYNIDFDNNMLYDPNTVAVSSYDRSQHSILWSNSLFTNRIQDRFYDNIRGLPVVKNAIEYMNGNKENSFVECYSKNMFICHKSVLEQIKYDMTPVITSIMKNISNGIGIQPRPRAYGWLMECLTLIYLNMRHDLRKIRYDCIGVGF